MDKADSMPGQVRSAAGRWKWQRKGTKEKCCRSNTLSDMQTVFKGFISRLDMAEERISEQQHARPLCPPLSPGVCPSSCLLTPWCHPIISSSVAPFSFCLQSFPSSGSFPMSQLCASSDQSIGASASASVLPVNIQGWFPLGLTGLIFLQSKGLSRVFSSTTIWKHQFFNAQPL